MYWIYDGAPYFVEATLREKDKDCVKFAPDEIRILTENETAMIIVMAGVVEASLWHPYKLGEEVGAVLAAQRMTSFLTTAFHARLPIPSSQDWGDAGIEHGFQEVMEGIHGRRHKYHMRHFRAGRVLHDELLRQDSAHLEKWYLKVPRSVLDRGVAAIEKGGTEYRAAHVGIVNGVEAASACIIDDSPPAAAFARLTKAGDDDRVQERADGWGLEQEYCWRGCYAGQDMGFGHWLECSDRYLHRHICVGLWAVSRVNGDPVSLGQIDGAEFGTRRHAGIGPRHEERCGPDDLLRAPPPASRALEELGMDTAHDARTLDEMEEEGHWHLRRPDMRTIRYVSAFVRALEHADPGGMRLEYLV